MTLVDRLLGSNIPYVTYAVPFFLLLIAVELVISFWTRRELYRFNDSVSDLSCGVIDQVLRVFLELFLFAGYLFLFRNYRLFEIQEWSTAGKWTAAIGLLFAVDFCFYWFHRIAHEYAAPWATHVVHHQSEEYNLAVALRQSAFESCFAWIFYLPLALVGFPPLWYAAISAINLLYQFWVHTEAIGKLGPLEWVMNTPSHHRVHHARNPKYLDRNYAGMFIIWDRLFGTFQVEDEQPVYGLTRPLESWNPVWANLHYWVYLFQLARKAPYWSDKVKLWFKPLGWMPRGVEPLAPPAEVTRGSLQKFNPRVPRRLSLYVGVQFVLALVGGVLIMYWADQKIERWKLILPVAAVIWTLMNLGAIFEKRAWVFRSELLRLTAIFAVAVGYAARTDNFPVTAAIVASWFLVSLAWFWNERPILRGKRRASGADEDRTSRLSMTTHAS